MSIEVSRRKVLQLAMAPALLLRRQMQDLAPTVSKVYPGSDGKLVYVPDEQGNTILDSSRATAGRWPATTPKMFRRPSIECPRFRSTGAVSAAPCC